MRDIGLNWIDKAIKVILAISALLVVAGVFTVVHFVIKFW